MSSMSRITNITEPSGQTSSRRETTNEFAKAFRELVIPQLSQRCRTGGFCIARGRWTFSEASEFVWALAQRRGARHLPDDISDELDQWIDAEVLEASIAMENDDIRGAYVREVVP
jgi:hypothetical protein